jgi:hypothetical protein
MCNKLLFDIEAAAHHASTEKHKRQLQYYEQSRSLTRRLDSGATYDIAMQNLVHMPADWNSSGRCNICSVTVADTYQLLQHIGSKKHKAYMEWFQRVQAAKAIGKFLSSKDRDPRSLVQGSSYDHLTVPANFVVSHEIAQFIRSLPRGVFVRDWDYFCSICESKIQSDDFVARHFHNREETRIT